VEAWVDLTDRLSGRLRQRTAAGMLLLLLHTRAAPDVCLFRRLS
jgi:hypothetical protein